MKYSHSKAMAVFIMTSPCLILSRTCSVERVLKSALANAGSSTSSINAIFFMFCRLGDFMKYSHSKAMAVFYNIVKLVKNGVLMIIHIYAKVSILGE
jgi:hypothetical protein